MHLLAASTEAGLNLGSERALLALGVLLVAGGMSMRLYLGNLWMRAEERAKDGWLNEQQVRRRVALVRFGGPLMILAGTAVLLIVISR